jgi:hypothetical protein
MVSEYASSSNWSASVAFGVEEARGVGVGVIVAVGGACVAVGTAVEVGARVEVGRGADVGVALGTAAAAGRGVSVTERRADDLPGGIARRPIPIATLTDPSTTMAKANRLDLRAPSSLILPPLAAGTYLSPTVYHMPTFFDSQAHVGYNLAGIHVSRVPTGADPLASRALKGAPPCDRAL